MRRIVSWYRPLPPQARLPMAAPGWSCTGAALFALTEGGFDPRVHSVKGRRPLADGPSKKISVIAPTSFARHAFHPLLYECHMTTELSGFSDPRLPNAGLCEQGADCGRYGPGAVLFLPGGL